MTEMTPEERTRIRHSMGGFAELVDLAISHEARIRALEDAAKPEPAPETKHEPEDVPTDSGLV